MFNNWIGFHDLLRLWDKLMHGEWRRALRQVGRNARERTRCAWQHTQGPPLNAWNIPQLRRRWNQRISGDGGIDHVEYIRRRFLQEKAGLTAFSPGCGCGGNEMRWARTGLFRRIDACDLSAPRIDVARQAAGKEGLEGILNFQVGNMGSMAVAGAYDLVITEGALHHFYPMRRALAGIRDMLKPGGLLVINEFVGPSRFQWTRQQLRAANELLGAIPEAYRRRWEDGRVKKRIDAPGRLRMLLADPSEAAESSLILPLLKEMFLPLEIREKGGTLSCLVFHGIAHHYLQEDETASGILSACFAREDQLMASGEISSDYVLAVFQKPQQ
ncbi:MAG: class I SAM-dependent methyltransferase [Acidobacteria bacterium]|jgi:SAM-dependent methyltransferase|nr:class I SAM-dependent methyltransferase [Acidobacteriota bacterium]